MAKKVGTLIKEARTSAGLTQEALAKKVKGLTANDISLAERGEKELTQAVLKEIAKATGVTQKSLLDAVKSSGSSSSSKKSAEKAASKKSTEKASSKKSAEKVSSKKSAEKASSKKSGTSSTKKNGTSSSKKSGTSSSSGKTGQGTSFKVSTEEKKLIQSYRNADPKVQAAVKMMLLGSGGISLPSSASDAADGTGDLFGALLGSVKNLLG